MLKNPCVDCTKRNTRVSKSRRKRLTANPFQDNQKVTGSVQARPTRGELHQRSQHHLTV